MGIFRDGARYFSEGGGGAVLQVHVVSSGAHAHSLDFCFPVRKGANLKSVL